MDQADDTGDATPRWIRASVLAGRVLPLLAIGLPVLLVVAGLGFLPDEELRINFVVLAAIAGAFAAAFRVLQQIVRRRGTPLSRRESTIVLVGAALAVVAVLGAVGLPAIPAPIGSLAVNAFVHGLFGVGVCVGLLIASVLRRPDATPML
jgi:hypothetical protein